MRTTAYLITLCGCAVLLSIPLFSCSDKASTQPSSYAPAIPSDMVYPLYQNASWSYSGAETFRNIRPESLAYRMPKPTHFTSTVTVGAIDSSLSPVFPFAVAETAILITGNQTVTAFQTNLLQNFQDGLYNFGWTGNFKNNASLRPNADSPRFSLGNKIIDDQAEWLFLQTSCLCGQFLPRTSDPAATSEVGSAGSHLLEYPISVGQEWDYYPINTCGYWLKKVTAAETVTVPAGTFDCLKIEWIPLNPDGTLWSSAQLTDYVAAEGLIKRVLHCPNAMWSTSQYTVYADLLQTIELKSLYLPEAATPAARK